MTVPCNVVRLGTVDYMEAWDLQSHLAQEVQDGRSDGWLLALEHPRTYTFGRQGHAENLRLTPEELDEMGAKVYWVERAGDVTYHGPGQLVIYAVINLRLCDGGARWFVGALETALVESLAAFGVEAEIREGQPGIWVGQDKIAAIGLHISPHGITTHGLALNVSTDLEYFSHINSCGLTDVGDTSMSRVLGRPVSVEDVIDVLLPALVRHLNLEARERSAEEMLAATPAP